MTVQPTNKYRKFISQPYSIVAQSIDIFRHKVKYYVAQKLKKKTYWLVKTSVYNVCLQGGFLAALSSTTEFTVVSLSGKGKTYKHRVKKDVSQVDVQQCLAQLTCLTAHPSEDCVAVGHADGKINIW